MIVLSRQMNTLEIRTVTPEDNQAVLDIYRQCEDFLALGPEPHASLAMVLKDIEEARLEGGVFRGIFSGDKMIGVVSYVAGGFEGKPDIAFHLLLMITPSFRGKGTGTEIVKRIEKEILSDFRISMILSGVQVNNPRAVRFWQQNGYRIVGGLELMPDKTTVFRLRKDREQP